MNFFKRTWLKIAGFFRLGRRTESVNHAVAVQEERDFGESGILEWLGLGNRGNPAAEATYFTCLKMMAESLAKMPIKYYQKTDKGIMEAPDTDMSCLLRVRPNPYQTPTTFWSTVEMNRNHHGNGYVYIQRSFKRGKYGGTVKNEALWNMPSNSVRVFLDDAGIFNGEGKLWYVYTDKYSGKRYVFPNEDVIHVKTSYSFDGIMGLPVRVILESMVNGVAAAQECLNNLYRNGLTAKAALEYTGDLSEEGKRRLREAFEELASGSGNAGRVVPLPIGMKLVPMDIKLCDAQFYELRKYSALQIAAAFGIKPNQINDYEKSSYANSESQQIAFLVDTMLYALKQYEEEIRYKAQNEQEIAEGKYYKFNEKVILRTDSETQMRIFKEGVNNGIYMPNEVRYKLDMPYAEGGDRLIVNGNYIPIESVGKQYGITDGKGDEASE